MSNGEYENYDGGLGDATCGALTAMEMSPLFVGEPTRLDMMRNLAIEIMHGAILGQELVARRLKLMPEYATHHEDYKPMFDLIVGLAINLQALLKHAELEEMRNAGTKDSPSST